MNRRKAAKTVGKAAHSGRHSTQAVNQSARSIETELVRFSTADRSIDFNIDATDETVWATQQQISDLFDIDKSGVSIHLKNIIDSNELDEGSVVVNFATTALDGKVYSVRHYNLDAILAVGFRVNSRRASEFRRWVAKIFRSYVTKGYALNEERLRNDPAAADELAAKLREIRASEKSVFATVRDFFALASTDYDPKARACGMFYAVLQDKFHFAATGQIACELILSRADHRQANMGLQTFRGAHPKVDETKIGKNYLDQNELLVLHLISEQFLLYVQSKVIRNQKMTMGKLAQKLDELLRVNEYAVFPGYKGKKLRTQADRHAIAEYARYLVRQKRFPSDSLKPPEAA